MVSCKETQEQSQFSFRNHSFTNWLFSPVSPARPSGSRDHRSHVSATHRCIVTGLGGSAKRAGSVPQIRPGGYPRSDFFETWLGSQKRGKDSQLGHLGTKPGTWESH